MGLLVVRIKFFAGDRPATVWYPFATFKIDVVEQCTTTTPDACSATEETQTRLIQIVVLHTDVCTTTEILCVLLILESAAFKQAYAVAEPGQPTRQRNARCTCTYDTHITPAIRSGRFFAKVDQHCCPLII